jgi:hypothetical protein
VLSVERPGGPPLISPIWYRYAPGGVVEMTTEAEAEKARLLETSGRATLCVQREENPPAYVTVEGPVSTAPASHELRVDIATRYLGPEMGRAYADSSADGVALTLTPSRWRTVDYTKL